MCKKTIYLASFILAMSLILQSTGEADPNLVGWWKLDEGSGTIAYDSSIYGNDGTLVGDPQWVTGRIDGAADFDGDGDYIDCGPDPNFEPDSITVAAWVNIRTIPTAWMSVVAKGEYSWRLSTVATHPSFFFGINHWEIPGSSILSTSGVEANEWHHISATYDGATMRLYHDGVLNNSLASAVGIGTAETNLLIGTNPQAISRYWDGLIDDVRIYKRALTQEEINGLIVTYKAIAPSPADDAIDVPVYTTISWTPGHGAVSHHVYFGTDFDDVNNANATSHPNVEFTNTDVNSYDPGILEFNTTYYWRIDEVNGMNLWRGDVWTFTSANYDYIVVDDFEAYNCWPLEDQIWYTWRDGFGWDFLLPPFYYFGNGTGAYVGDVTTDSCTEETIVHGCRINTSTTAQLTMQLATRLLPITQSPNALLTTHRTGLLRT